MIRGVTASVRTPILGARDRFGNLTVSWSEPVDVANVLVSPNTTADLEAGRPDGDSLSLTLHFPKGFTASLENCEIDLPEPWGNGWRVIGDPKPYIDANTPTEWDRPATVEKANG